MTARLVNAFTAWNHYHRKRIITLLRQAEVSLHPQPLVCRCRDGSVSYGQQSVTWLAQFLVRRGKGLPRSRQIDGLEAIKQQERYRNWRSCRPFWRSWLPRRA